MGKKAYAQLTQGSVARQLIRLTFPMTWGIFAMMAFNLIDTFFVGRLGTNELAAMSFTFPVVMVIGGIAMGLGVAASSLISRAIGEGDRTKVQRLTLSSLAFSFLLVAVFVVIGLKTIKPLFAMLGAGPDILPLIARYMNIWYVGMLFVVVPMVGNNAIRATGDTMMPAFIMASGAIANAILDPIMIFGMFGFPRLDLAGAALATVLARFVTLVLSLSILYYKKKMISFSLFRLREMLQLWGQLLYIGIPAAATFMIVPFSMGFITNFISSFGPKAVAGFGVAIRIEGFVMILIIALSSVMGPFVGQNWGARNYERIRRALVKSFSFSLGWGVVLAFLFLLTARRIAGLFNPDPIVVSTAVLYLSIVPVSYSAGGIIHISSSTYNALGKPFLSTAMVLLRTFIIYVPLAYAGRFLFGVSGIFAAAAVANFIVGIIACSWMVRLFGKPPRRLFCNFSPLFCFKRKGILPLILFFSSVTIMVG